MSPTGWMFATATLLGATGMWLMLPRGRAGGRAVGVVLGIAAMGLFGSQIATLDGWLANRLFQVLATLTVVAAAGAVTLRNPVYCAIWFALSLLGTAGLFMIAGAQFLAVSTIVVYAGAIVVTLLFVLMLANPEGHAAYDRVSWEAPLSAAAGAVMVGILTMTLAGVFKQDTAFAQVASAVNEFQPAGAEGPVLRPSDIRRVRLTRDEGRSTLTLDIPQHAEVTDEQLAQLQAYLRDEVPGLKLGRGFELIVNQQTDVLARQHVAQLGAQLFSRHLIAVEVAGTLLLVALVGAVAVVLQTRAASGQGAESDPSTEAPGHA